MIDIPPPPPAPAQQIEAISRCGIPAEKITVSNEAELQSEVVSISDAGEVTEQKWVCLLDAVHPFYSLQLEDPGQRASFYEVEQRERQKRARAESTAWLRARGMLDRVPPYERGSDISAFARAVEEACSIPTGTMLQAKGDHLTFRRDAPARLIGDGATDKLACLMHVMFASNAPGSGMMFGIVGNDRVSPDGETP